MFTAYVVVTLLAIGANSLSGIAALVHFKPILPGMVKARVPESWLTFPIGTLKTAGAVGLLLGVIGVPLIGTAAAVGLILYFVCAFYTHIRAGDYSQQFGWRSGSYCWLWLLWCWTWPLLGYAFTATSAEAHLCEAMIHCGRIQRYSASRTKRSPGRVPLWRDQARSAS